MKNNIIYFFLAGILITLFACKKDEDQAILKSSPTAPTLTVPATMVLDRDKATDKLLFEGSAADFGFDARIVYSLQADVEGNDFADATTIMTNFENSFEMQISEFNSSLLDIIKEDVPSNVELRVLATVEGSVDPVSSNINASVITPFGLPRLDINITGASEVQKIVSPAGDGEYSGYVKFKAGDTFTLTDPDASVTYGGNGSTISVGGAAISVVADGWYKLEVSTVDLTMDNLKYLVGIVGTVNGWAAPDYEMDYDQEGKFWYYDNLELASSDAIKFRHNEDWGNDFNLGVRDKAKPDLDDLWNNGDSKDIVVSNAGLSAGIYKVKLWLSLDKTPNAKCAFEKVE